MNVYIVMRHGYALPTITTGILHFQLSTGAHPTEVGESDLTVVLDCGEYFGSAVAQDRRLWSI